MTTIQKPISLAGTRGLRALAAVVSLVLAATLLAPASAPAQPPAPEEPAAPAGEAFDRWLGLETGIAHDALAGEAQPMGPPVTAEADASTADASALEDLSRIAPPLNGVHSIESHPVLPFTFLTVPSENLLIMVNSRTADFVEEFLIPNEPSAMAFSPDGEYLYLASRSNPLVRVVAIGHYLATDEWLPTEKIPLTVRPRDLVMGATGILHVLGNSASFNGIVSVDVSTGDVLSTFDDASAAFNLGEMEINKAGTRLYYANHGVTPSTLSKINVVANPPTIIVQSSVGVNGQDLALSLDGTVAAYANTGGQGLGFGIGRMNTANLSISGSWNTGPVPYAVGLGPDLTWTVTSSTMGFVDIWDNSTMTPLGSWQIPGTAIELHVPPTGLWVFALSDDGRVYPLGTGMELQGVELCYGLPVTVDMSQGQTATAGMDVIMGTAGADVIDDPGGSMNIICAGSGDDTFRGSDGRDLFDGGPGDDEALGRDGDDILLGGDGRDTLAGGFGDDLLFGEGDVDRLKGDFGNDEIYGDGGSDRIHGGFGDDYIEAGSGADKVWGGGGNDFINGMGGQDRLYGGSGDDTIQGSHQSDRIYGNAGKDILRGAAGKDTLDGQAGDDELFGGDNSDTLIGGSGDDLHDGQRGSDTCDRTGATAGDVFVSC